MSTTVIAPTAQREDAQQFSHIDDALPWRYATNPAQQAAPFAPAISRTNTHGDTAVLTRSKAPWSLPGRCAVFLFVAAGYTSTLPGNAAASGLDEIASRPGFIPFIDVLLENQEFDNECTDYDIIDNTCTIITNYLVAGSSGTSIAEFILSEEPYVVGIGTIPIIVVDGFVCASFEDAELDIVADDATDADFVTAIAEPILTAMASLGELCGAYFLTDVESQYRTETYTLEGEPVLGMPPELVTYVSDDAELRYSE